MTTTAPKTIGRPKTSGSERIAIEDSRIYLFLEKHFPQFCVRGRLNIYQLAEATKYSHQAIYHWFSKDKMPPEAGAKLVEVADGAFTFADVSPFFLRAAK